MAQSDAALAALFARGLQIRKERHVGEIDWRRCIGAGAFASVYATVDDRRHAVKVVRRACLSEKATRQLERECVLHATVSHANICELVCVADGSDGNGGPALHLVLAACVGDLETALAVGAPLPPLAPSIIAQVLDALAHLHDSHSIVHADVKPENVLVFPGRLKLAGAAPRRAHEVSGY